MLAGLGAGGLAILGIVNNILFLEYLGRMLIFVCWAVVMVCLSIGIPGAWSGKYRNLPEKPWREQLW
jgi:uncharacterized membrane protein